MVVVKNGLELAVVHTTVAEEHIHALDATNADLAGVCRALRAGQSTSISNRRDHVEAL